MFQGMPKSLTAVAPSTMQIKFVLHQNESTQHGFVERSGHGGLFFLMSRVRSLAPRQRSGDALSLDTGQVVRYVCVHKHTVDGNVAQCKGSLLDVVFPHETVAGADLIC